MNDLSHTPAAATQTPALTPMSVEDFEALDAILDELRTRHDETPQWDFCEGFLAALVCCRRRLPDSEWLPVLLDLDDGGAFADAAQQAQFLALWARRFAEVQAALDRDTDNLNDDHAYAPEVMDVRGAVAAMPEAERADIADSDIPAFGQVWAVGFMYVVENWPQEWLQPKDKAAAAAHDEALEAMVAMTEDDLDPPTLSAMDEDGPPSVSQSRLDAYAQAVWAVYDLRAIWRDIGARVQQVVGQQSPGRNDPCSCGSGKKFKKCCGA